MTTIDFFEKEVKRLQERFNATFGQAKTVNVTVRYLAILAICRARSDRPVYQGNVG